MPFKYINGRIVNVAHKTVFGPLVEVSGIYPWRVIFWSLHEKIRVTYPLPSPVGTVTTAAREEFMGFVKSVDGPNIGIDELMECDAVRTIHSFDTSHLTTQRRAKKKKIGDRQSF